MKEWQKLSEKEMDVFINTVCQKLNITTWSGIDMADIYEKAIAIKSLQNTAPNTVYTKCKCSDPECDGIGYYNITCDKCGEGLIF